MTEAGVGIEDGERCCARVVGWACAREAPTRTSAPMRRAMSDVSRPDVVRGSGIERLLHGSDLNAAFERLFHGAAVGDLQQAGALLGGERSVQLHDPVETSRADRGRLGLEAILDVRWRVAHA